MGEVCQPATQFLLQAFDGNGDVDQRKLTSGPLKQASAAARLVGGVLEEGEAVVEVARGAGAGFAQRPGEGGVLALLDDADVVAAQREAVGEATRVDGGRIGDVADDAAGEERDLQTLFLSWLERSSSCPTGWTRVRRRESALLAGTASRTGA